MQQIFTQKTKNVYFNKQNFKIQKGGIWICFMDCGTKLSQLFATLKMKTFKGMLLILSRLGMDPHSGQS